MARPKNNIHWLKYIVESFLPPLALVWLYREKVHKKDRTFWNVTIAWSILWSLCIVGLLIVPTNNQPNAPSSSFSGVSEISTENNTNIADSNQDGSQTKTDVVSSDSGSNSNDSASNTTSAGNYSSKTLTDGIATSDGTNIAISNSAMSGIEIKEAEDVPYSRDSYGAGWDAGVGCNIRARMLQSTSIVSFTTSNGCTVTYGSWIDPYTGKTFTGNPYRGDGTENDLDIDHVIPLAYVNAHGGYHWSDNQKVSYGSSLEAMNNGVYLVVSASENRKKSDKGPSEYYPPNSDFKCEYSRLWRDIARLYSIALSYEDYIVVSNTLEVCGIE